MKYVFVIPDGAADERCDALGGKTPLQAARKPHMDRIAREGVLGRSRNVPDIFLPASDVATLSLFGYDPVKYYTGRAPLEAIALGIQLGPNDWAVRCNLVTILGGNMTDFTAGHIRSEEGASLIAALNEHVRAEGYDVEFVPGVSYRNLMIVRGKPGQVVFSDDTRTTPPHDIPDQPTADSLPSGTGSSLLRSLMAAGSAIVRDHPVSQMRESAGLRPCNAIWLWGQGRAPSVPRFQELHGFRGAIIAAVDLVRGTGMLAGWDRIDVPGATGYLDTDYAAKGHYAVQALNDYDLVCVHIEAPDEASHEGRAEAKVEAIERIDERIVGPLLSALQEMGTEWRILVSPDHSTMLRTRAHDRAPVPWAMCGTGLVGSGYGYDEISAEQGSGPFLEEGWRLMERFLRVS